MNLSTEQFEERLLEKTRSGELVWEYSPAEYIGPASLGRNFNQSIEDGWWKMASFSLTTRGFSLQLLWDENKHFSLSVRRKIETTISFTIKQDVTGPGQWLKQLLNILQDLRREQDEPKKQEGRQEQQSTLDELSQQLA